METTATSSLLCTAFQLAVQVSAVTFVPCTQSVNNHRYAGLRKKTFRYICIVWIPEQSDRLPYQWFSWCCTSKSVAVITLSCYKWFCFGIKFYQEHTLLYTGDHIVAAYSAHWLLHTWITPRCLQPSDTNVINIRNIGLSFKQSLRRIQDIFETGEYYSEKLTTIVLCDIWAIKYKTIYKSEILKLLNDLYYRSPIFCRCFLINLAKIRFTKRQTKCIKMNCR
jgi:hypothetical protein